VAGNKQVGHATAFPSILATPRAAHVVTRRACFGTLFPLSSGCCALSGPHSLVGQARRKSLHSCCTASRAGRGGRWHERTRAAGRTSAFTTTYRRRLRCVRVASAADTGQHNAPTERAARAHRTRTHNDYRTRASAWHFAHSTNTTAGASAGNPGDIWDLLSNKTAAWLGLGLLFFPSFRLAPSLQPPFSGGLRLT